jgi:hypothetical protein
VRFHIKDDCSFKKIISKEREEEHSFFLSLLYLFLLFFCGLLCFWFRFFWLWLVDWWFLLYLSSLQLIFISVREIASSH